MGKYRFEDLSNEDLRDLVDSLHESDVPLFLIDPAQNRVIFANDAWTSHAARLHENFKNGMPLTQALKVETDEIAGQLPDDAREKIASQFADTIHEGGQYEFGAPDGKLYRGNYSRGKTSQTLGISFDVTEIKTRRLEARRARKSLNATLEGLHHGVMLYDETGHVQYFNDSFLETAESLGIKLEKGMFHLDLREQLPTVLVERLSQEGRLELGDFEFVQETPAGKHYLFESRRLSNNTVLVSTVDVTELEEKRAEARNIRETLEKTLGGLDHGVMLVDLTGHVVYCNESQKRFATETGANIEVGMHFSEIRKNVPHQDPINRPATGGDFEYVVDGHDGSAFMVKRRFLEDIGILVSTVDITELTQKKAESNHLKVMMEKSLEGLPHGVLLYNEIGEVEYFNSEFEKAFLPLGSRIQKGMSHKEVAEKIPEEFKKDLRGNKPGESFELIQKGHDGRSYLIEGRALDGVGYLLSTVDVTELQNAMEAAKAADIAKSSFLANMSHEIRTPMNGVLGMAQVLEQTAVDTHQQKCIDIIKESSELLLRIINDILDISKLDATKVEIEARPFSLEKIVNSAVAIVKPKLEEKPGLEIILDVQDALEHNYVGDAGRIRQVLINLLGNGVKFTQSGHVKLTVKTSPSSAQEDQIWIQVEDTGIGISPENIDKIFERFEQSDMSTTRQFGGTGLGLSISRKLSVLMGGDLSVCRERTEGACFRFSLTLPRKEREDDNSRRTIRSFENFPVLVIDDNKVNHMVIAHQLEALKVKTFCVDSADRGLAILKKMAQKNYKIPLVICDYQMPIKTGYDFVKSLKADPEIADTPVMIISSADVISRRKHFVELGVSTVLEKPCSKTELVAAASEELTNFLSRQTGANDRQAEATKSAEPPTQKETARKRILVADDDPVNRQVFAGFIKLFGHDVVLVNNGLEALKTYAKESFDLVIMDISMPVLCGQKATQKIREYEARKGRTKTPIIAVTAHALKGDKEKFLASGMDDYLAKPILKPELQAMIDTWFEREVGSGPISALAS